MPMERVMAGLVCWIVRNRDPLSTIIIVRGACELSRNQEAHRFNVYSHQPEVEERMQVGSEKQSVAGVVRSRPLIWNDMCCLQYGLHITPSDGALALVGRKQFLRNPGCPDAERLKRRFAHARL